MKIEILKGCIFILIGAYLCKGFQPETSPNQPIISQVEVKAANKCVIRNVVKPDGTKEQTLESSQVVEQDATQHVQIFPKQEPRSALLAGGYVNSDFTFGASIGLNTPEWDIDLSSDLKKDHRLSGKRTILRW